MKTIIVGQAFVVTSGQKLEVLQKAGKVLPEALVLKNEDKEPIFAIATGSKGSISKSGICYDAADSTGLAQTTVALPSMDASKRKQYVEDNYGAALVLAKQCEDSIATALESRNADIQAVLGEMEVR